jgi:hypothetical protein
MDCPECERLNDEEADAAIELVAADQAVSPSATVAELETQKRQKLAAEARWRSSREQLAAHQASHSLTNQALTNQAR